MKYIERDGRKREETSSQDRLLSFLYGHVWTRALLRLFVVPAVSKAGGHIMDSRLSVLFIKPFVKKNGIDLSCYEKKTFRSYNDFFTRRIRPELRPVAREPEALISPCDGKLSIYRIGERTRFCIKHTTYSVTALLQSKKLAERFEGGYAVVIRLTVDDYHRYCYVAQGEVSAPVRIPGVLHTVNPVANDVYPIYKMNAREYCVLHTERAGDILMMEVGALFVGKIRNYPVNGPVKKGQEKGMFEFGGSTVVLLLQKDRVKPDEDLLRNTDEGFETIIKLGEKIGTVQ